MAYKDKDKQKEQSRLRQQRYRQNRKSVTKRNGSVTDVTQNESVTDNALRLEDLPCVIPYFGQSDCQCKHCQNNRKNGSRKIINHGLHKKRHELGQNELNRVVFRSDPDYSCRAVVPEYSQSLPDGSTTIDNVQAIHKCIGTGL